jgi:hypothetical protein
METVYAIPGALALAAWFLAVVLYAVGWQQKKKEYGRAGDGLALAGLIAALAGVVWLAWRAPLGFAFTRSSLATGLAVLIVVEYMLLVRSGEERLPARVTLGLAVPLQAYAVGQLWWGVDVAPADVFLPIWAAVGMLAGLVGYASLAVAAIMMVLSSGSSLTTETSSTAPLADGTKFWELEWRFTQIALIALSLSLAARLARAWWGLGQLMIGGFTWALITWLLLVASTYAQMQDAIPRRPARALFALASAMGILSALAMAG